MIESNERREGRSMRRAAKRFDVWDRRMICVIESLESRQLLSASLLGGVLTIDGTADADAIVIVAGREDGQVRVKKAPGVDPKTVFDGVDAIQINGLAGNDTIVALGNFTDTLGNAIGVSIDGGDGNDKILTGKRDDTIAGGDGDDRIIDLGGDNDIDGEDGDDHIISGKGDDDIDGGAGDDHIKDRGGDNTVLGGVGMDRIKCGKGDDTIDAGDDDDRVKDSGGNNEVSLGAGDDYYRGGKDAEHVQGDDGNDHILGGRGDDFLEGGNGDDKLKGQRGADYMSGGAGDDDYDRHRNDDIDYSPSDGESDADDDHGDDDDDHGDVSTQTVTFAGDNTAQITGTSDSHDDRNFYRFVAPISGTLSVQITADSGPLAEAELEDAFSVHLLELEDGNDNGSAAVVAGRTYFLRMRAPGDAASTYTVDLAIT